MSRVRRSDETLDFRHAGLGLAAARGAAFLRGGAQRDRCALRRAAEYFDGALLPGVSDGVRAWRAVAGAGVGLDAVPLPHRAAAAEGRGGTRYCDALCRRA